MRIGTMFLGTVDSAGGESIQTKFLVIGVPIAPLSSHYVMSESMGGIRGFEIPIHGKSVGMAYLRTASWLVALLCGLMYFIDKREFGSCLYWAIGAGVLAVASTFFMGKLGAKEKLRRLLLRQITGVGAPPEYLPSELRDETAEKLRAQWEKDNSGAQWDRHIENGSSDLLLFAVAEYHLRPDLAQRVLDHLALGSGGAPAEGVYR